MKKLKNEKDFFEYGVEKDVLLNVMPKFGIQSTTDIKEPGMSVWVVKR